MASDYRSWKDMPGPAHLVTLSWEDIYLHAKENLHVELTREQVIRVFEEMDQSGLESSMDLFWEAVRVHVLSVLDGDE